MHVEQNQQQSQSKKKFWCKIFRTKHDLVGAFCDKNLLGKEIKDKKFDIKVSKHFYGGAEISEKAAVNIMRKITIGNIIGKEIVKLAQDNGFITKENTILINGIPHAQFAKLQAR